MRRALVRSGLVAAHPGPALPPGVLIAAPQLHPCPSDSLIARRADSGRASCGVLHLIASYCTLLRLIAARQAIAWLRIVRPGSVIGPQQHFLVALEVIQRLIAAYCALLRHLQRVNRFRPLGRRVRRISAMAASCSPAIAGANCCDCRNAARPPWPYPGARAERAPALYRSLVAATQ